MEPQIKENSSVGEVINFVSKDQLVDSNIQHWHDKNPINFSAEERSETTLLFGGLTEMHDQLLEAGVTALGYKAKALPEADYAALQCGKEYGNRGQCNPTYFTVGNLVNYLCYLRDDKNLSVAEIIKSYLFVTAATCGPCRFGMYVTEYRKALRDAGFEGFRILSFQGGNAGKEGNKNDGLKTDLKFFSTAIKCVVIADVLNAIGYRIRPYEIEEGATDHALSACKDILRNTIDEKKSLIKALYQCRKLLVAVKTDFTQVKPKVLVIGEFWAMTTEGDGNYRLQRFLEQEGAECEVQPITNWLLYMLWEEKSHLKETMLLRKAESTANSYKDKKSIFASFQVSMAALGLKGFFYGVASLVGLKKYKLSDMDEIARISHPYYLNEVRGGEGHMEVGKLIQAVEQKKAHLVISVKPFGCMPSSGVSDGIQSLITARYPEANFLAIETTGDGAVNVYSRVQMALFRARKQAQKEFGKVG